VNSTLNQIHKLGVIPTALLAPNVFHRWLQRLTGILFAGLLFTGSAITSSAQTTTGTITTCAAPGTGNLAVLTPGGFEMTINSVGDIAGYYLDSGSVYHGYLRTP